MRGPLHYIKSSWRFIVEVAKEWYYGGIGDLAAGVTFWILLTLPAAVLALVSGLGWLSTFVGTGLSDDVEQDALNFVEGVLGSQSESIESTVRDLFSQQNSGLLTLSLLLALWTISRGFAGLLRALDRIYDVDDGRPWYITRVVALLLGLGTLLIVASIALIEVLVWSRYTLPYESSLQFVSSVIILLLWAVAIYHWGPSERTKWLWDIPGALVAGVLMWLLTRGYIYYVQLSGSGNDVVGAIGGFILALTWVWLAAQALLIGGAVNSVLGDWLGINRAKRRWRINERINERIFRTGEVRQVSTDIGAVDGFDHGYEPSNDPESCGS